MTARRLRRVARGWSGQRDAANLAWKLAGVLAGSLPETVLDTYETERRPHARAMIRRAKLVGTVMTGGGELGKLLRGVLAPRLHRLSRFTDQAPTCTAGCAAAA